MKGMTAKELGELVQRAVALVPKHVPPADRSPAPGGGAVCATATGILVALRALVDAAAEMDARKP
jgi:formiminotetrahydrofolate cyclodeaminase